MRIERLIVPIFLTASCFLSAFFAQASSQCANTFDVHAYAPSPFPALPQWRKSSGGNLFSALRANAPHNWAYFKSIQPQLKYLKGAFEVQGIGIGDFHILNIGDIELAKGDRKIGLIDVDDGGRTSLFADITRAVISNQVSPYKISPKELWDAYIAGLKGKKADKPKFIEKALSHSHKDYLEHQEKYLDEMIDHKTFSAAAQVHPLSEADPLTQDIYQKSHAIFEKTLGEVTILDQGFKIKDTGGSQGIPRFWYLIKKDGNKSIIEFKTLAEPAMELYQHQPSQQVRIEELIELYRPQKSTYGIYKFIDGGQYQFIARERVQGFLRFHPEQAETDHEIKKGQEMYLYLLNKVGLWQSELGVGSKIIAALTYSENDSFSEFEKIINDYIEIMKKENNESF
ncbi:MAG: hypothetical protein ACXWRE_11380 [Pseudobdellovibrionaceae bacterium]